MFPECEPIHVYLISGETGTGKSSFINVLLGEDYLPTSLLPNTHVISEIRSSRDQSAYAIVFPTDEKENKPKKIELLGDDKETFKQELATYIQDTDAKTGKQIYNSAQIYLPCDILDVRFNASKSTGRNNNSQIGVNTGCSIHYIKAEVIILLCCPI